MEYKMSLTELAQSKHPVTINQVKNTANAPEPYPASFIAHLSLNTVD
jgi:hypothetical protein